MRSLRQVIRDWLVSDSGNVPESKQIGVAVGRHQQLDTSCTMHFSIFDAIGGKVVEFKRRDRHGDLETQAVYIIPSTENFSERIEKIIMLESLK